MPRFVFETQGVIDAETEEDAMELAEAIVAREKLHYGNTPRAVLATFDVESVAPKVAREPVIA